MNTEAANGHVIRIEDSCGCVFCDMGMPPETVYQGEWPVHLFRDGSFIRCTRVKPPEQLRLQ